MENRLGVNQNADNEDPGALGPIGHVSEINGRDAAEVVTLVPRRHARDRIVARVGVADFSRTVADMITDVDNGGGMSRPANHTPHEPRRGWLKNGNPPGDFSTAPRCGAKTRQGTPCQCPGMRNGRCRIHGGLSTGPKTAAGIERIRKALRNTPGKRVGMVR